MTDAEVLCGSYLLFHNIHNPLSSTAQFHEDHVRLHLPDYLGNLLTTLPAQVS